MIPTSCFRKGLPCLFAPKAVKERQWPALPVGKIGEAAPLALLVRLRLLSYDGNLRNSVLVLTQRQDQLPSRETVQPSARRGRCLPAVHPQGAPRSGFAHQYLPAEGSRRSEEVKVNERSHRWPYLRYRYSVHYGFFKE